MSALSSLADRPQFRLSAALRADLDERVLETASLTDRRGYGVTLSDFARLLYKGPAPADEVAAAIERIPTLALISGLVVRRDREPLVPEMVARQASHRAHAADAERLAHDFVGRLTSSCPLVRSVSLTGSMSSGGFHPGDDVDLNLVVRDGAKYTVYLWSLALSAITSLRNIHKQTDEMSALPFLPKIICINVVWEEGQVRPLARRDKWLAYELLMHKPLIGSAFWRDVLRDNAWIGEHFPQVFEPEFSGADAESAVRLAGARRAGRGLFAFLDRHPRGLGLAEAFARVTVIALHKLVSVYREKVPAAHDREAFVNLVKHPYSVYDVPGRETDVPPEALRARESVASPLR